MSKRKIITVDEGKCTGCGKCVTACPEGALQIVNGKAKVVNEFFCDGLGACIGQCPEGALLIEERDAQEYNESMVVESIAKQGPEALAAHLEHLWDHGEQDLLQEAVRYLKSRNIPVPEKKPKNEAIHACPFSQGSVGAGKKSGVPAAGAQAQSPDAVCNWPIQLKLSAVAGPHFSGCDLVIAADCVGFACTQFHEKVRKGRVLLIGCPKLDAIGAYEQKLGELFRDNTIRSVTYAHMVVPCCSGFIPAIQNAINASGKTIPFSTVEVGINGDVEEEITD